MFDFADIRSASKDEMLRAWAVEKAVESSVGADLSNSYLIQRAAEIEKFVREGASE